MKINFRILLFLAFSAMLAIGVYEKCNGSQVNGVYRLTRTGAVSHMTYSGNLLIIISLLLFVLFAYLFTKYR